MVALVAAETRILASFGPGMEKTSCPTQKITKAPAEISFITPQQALVP
jgi:hypothetical protein